jgi:quercetin dioxygenase-like cupin family protein
VQTEVFYFFDDTGYRIVNGETIRPKAGDVLVIEPNDNHTAVNETDRDYIYICFKINYVPGDFYLTEK